MPKPDPESAPAWRRFLPVALLLAGAAAFFALGGHRYLTWESLRDNRDLLQRWVADNTLLAYVGYATGYAAITALSLPFGALATLAGGFLFGWLAGTICVVVGATAGAIAVFLAARSALGDVLARRAQGFMGRMKEGFSANQFSYLLFLRLMPIFPFWLVNIVPALLGMRLMPYALATVLGIIPGTLVFAAVGNGLGTVFDRGESPDFDLIFRPAILLPILALAVLSLAPVLYRRWQAGRK